MGEIVVIIEEWILLLWGMPVECLDILHASPLWGCLAHETTDLGPVKCVPTIRCGICEDSFRFWTLLGVNLVHLLEWIEYAMERIKEVEQIWFLVEHIRVGGQECYLLLLRQHSYYNRLSGGHLKFKRLRNCNLRAVLHLRRVLNRLRRWRLLVLISNTICLHLLERNNLFKLYIIIYTLIYELKNNIKEFLSIIKKLSFRLDIHYYGCGFESLRDSLNNNNYILLKCSS
jgi:hypothetical protein